MAVAPVITPDVVELNWAQIVEPNPDDAEVDGGKWTATVWFSKDDTDTKDQVEGLVEAAIADKKEWKGKRPKGKFTEFEFMDGDDDEHSYENDDTGEVTFPHKNQWGFRVKTSRKPVVVDRFGNKVEDQSKIGYTPKVKMKYSPFAYDNKWGKGITLSPDAFQVFDFGQATSQATADGFEYDDPTEVED